MENSWVTLLQIRNMQVSGIGMKTIPHHDIVGVAHRQNTNQCRYQIRQRHLYKENLQERRKSSGNPVPIMLN
jgi:hypothetical protein